MPPKGKQQQKKKKNAGQKQKARSVMARRSLPFHLVVPRSNMCSLVYVGSFAVSEGAVGVGTAKMLRLNAPYDVDPSLGSTAVAGFSEMAGFYQSYRVTHAAVMVNFAVTGVSAGGIGELSLFPTATSSVPSNAAAWMVQRRGVSKLVYPCNTQVGGTVPTMFLDIDIAAFLGLTREQYLTDHQYTASTTTIPNKLVFVACCLRSGGSSTAASATMTVRMAMEVQFFDPVVLSN